MICNEIELLNLAAQLANVIKQHMVIYLQGNLGAGKTTFARGFMRGLGYQGTIKSPTYTLIETYRVQDKCIYHFDLYRLTDPEELEFIGHRDYFADDAIVLIEWPEQGIGMLPPADLKIFIDMLADKRQLTLQPQSEIGKQMLLAAGLAAR